MNLRKQSAASIKSPSGKSDHIVWDDKLTGWGLRLRDGRRSWIVQYRLGGRTQRITIGDAVKIDGATAYKLAKDKLGIAETSADPRAALRGSKSAGEMFTAFLDSQKAGWKPRTYEEAERYLTSPKYWKPFASTRAVEITRESVAARLDVIESQSGSVTRNRARSWLSSAYVWGLGSGQFGVMSNPVVGTNKADEKPRDRVLDEDELAEIWLASGDDDFGKIVRLLILTGQRRDEIGAMRHDEIKAAKRILDLPGERTKNSRRHEVPLSTAALAILDSVTEIDGRDFVFGRSSGAGAFQGWDRAKKALDQRILDARKNSLGSKAKPLPDWTLHDIRRTVITFMHSKRVGVFPHIVEAVVNHVSGHKGGVAGVYNYEGYQDEKRDALDRWAAWVESLIASQTSNVVRMWTAG